MLTITPTAATVLNKARDEKGAPDGSNVRFFATKPEDSDRVRLAFKFVESPQAGDTHVAKGPMEAYVAPDVEELMGDVTIDTRGAGDDAGLVVKRSRTD